MSIPWECVARAGTADRRRILRRLRRGLRPPSGAGWNLGSVAIVLQDAQNCGSTEPLEPQSGPVLGGFMS